MPYGIMGVWGMGYGGYGVHVSLHCAYPCGALACGSPHNEQVVLVLAGVEANQLSDPWWYSRYNTPLCKTHTHTHTHTFYSLPCREWPWGTEGGAVPPSSLPCCLSPVTSHTETAPLTCTPKHRRGLCSLHLTPLTPCCPEGTMLLSPPWAAPAD